MKDNTSVLRKGVFDALLQSSDRALRGAEKLEKLSIPYSLTAQQQVKLNVGLPEFRLEYSTTPQSHPHALSISARICETQLVMSKLNYSEKTKIPSGYVAAIEDVGENFLTHLKWGRNNVHSCCPSWVFVILSGLLLV